MSSDASKKQPRPIEVARLVRPQNRIDIILNLDLMTGQSDVRSSMILDVTPEAVIVAQCDPPLLRSMIGREVEATIVHHDLVTYEPSRWGWQTRIISINNDYKLNPKDPDSVTATVVFLALPGRDGLKKTNVRQGYRIDVTTKDDIEFHMEPNQAPVQLLNFSAIGVMLSTQAPPAFKLGQEFRISMVFPEDDQMDKTVISAEAVIVRFEYEPGAQVAKMGLKYQEMGLNAARALHKVINNYMLDEQRKRNRGN